jgi:Mrp family chromosome partitioning ATPase
VKAVASAPGTATSSAPPLPVWLSPHWRRAGGLGALATVLLLLKWTLLVPPVYESQAVVVINRPADEKEPTTLRKLLALGGSGRERGAQEVQVEALPLDGQHVAFVCRASKAHAAHGRCGALVTRALGAKLARSVPRPASLPAQPLPFEHGWGIWLLSCAVGVAAALLWIAGHKLLHMRLHLPARALEGTRAGRVSKPPVPASSEVRSDRPSAIALGEGTLPEHLRTLRDRLFLLAADSCFVVGVSGTRDEADAKAIVAGQLALALAESEQVEVLLLEADFDQPAVHLVMDITMPPLAGFSQQIHQGVQQPGVTRPWTVVRRAPSLSVLAEGMLRTPGMMYSAQFSAAVAELRNAYDIIVVSGPAIGVSADVQAFADVVDGVVFVPLAQEDRNAVSKTASQVFRNKRFVSVVAPLQPDEA